MREARIKNLIEVMQAFLDGEIIEFYDPSSGWLEIDSTWGDKNTLVGFSEDMDWRIKDKVKLDIPWANIKREWMYAAMDGDGDVWVYEEEPRWHSYKWFNSDGVCADLSGVMDIDITGVTPLHSLTIRPECV